MGRKSLIRKILDEKINDVIILEETRRLNREFLRIREYIIDTINALYPEKKIDINFLENLPPEYEIERNFYYEFLNHFRF